MPELSIEYMHFPFIYISDLFWITCGRVLNGELYAFFLIILQPYDFCWDFDLHKDARAARLPLSLLHL